MTSPLLRILRVPPEPVPPDGSPGSIVVFRAGSNYYRWRLAIWALAQFGIFCSIALFIAITVTTAPRQSPAARIALQATAAAAVGLGLTGAAWSYFLQRLNYELRWYIVTDRSLRIRAGIWNVEEITMTFANIQNIRLRRDPLQLLLGIADLEVTSAGGGSGSPGVPSSSHTARFSGVDNAEALRDLIVERLRAYRDAGLGDPDQHSPSTAAEAAAHLLDEARKLRAAVT